MGTLGAGPPVLGWATAGGPRSIPRASIAVTDARKTFILVVKKHVEKKAGPAPQRSQPDIVHSY
jgi:hypothetical protein